MGILNSLFSNKPSEPAGIRETLFGDLPPDRWPPAKSNTDDFPWSAFDGARKHLASGNAKAACADWHRVLDRSGLEPRHYLQAWHFLRQQREQPPADLRKQLLGVVIEVTLPQGLDLVAAYPDYSARFYNYSGAAVVWEHPDNSLNGTIDNLLNVARRVVALIGPWDKPRPPAPAVNFARLSFLTPSGLHFGEGPFDALSKDPVAGAVVARATELMMALVKKSGVDLTRAKRP